ncbi:hypothetical protein MW887_004981 [Aspergillus wentii]|nr:hypothetical protein MW887_004981 [Aspergillus wentii]
MQLFSLFSFFTLPLALVSALRIPSSSFNKRGLLYITQTPDDNTANLTPVSWNLPSITDENWIVNGSFVNGTSAGSLYIKPEDNYCLGLLPMARASQLNGTVSGFALFASQLVFNNNTDLEAQFWAQSTGTEGIYSLIWNIGGNVASGSFPVVVKASED